MSTEPKVGDKVVYVPEEWAVGLPLRPEWQLRAETPSLVVEVGERAARCWTEGQAETWATYTRSLRVVERATYERVGEADG